LLALPAGKLKNISTMNNGTISPVKGDKLKDYLGRVSVIMPAFNESSVVYAGLLETARVLKHAKCDYELILVDDGSRDDTFAEAKRAQGEVGGIEIVRVPRNIGKGHAIRRGVDVASGDIIVFLDADLDLHPRQINSLFDVLVTNNADAVIGSKRHPQSKLDYPWYRKVMSDVYYLLVKALFGLPVRDTQTGIKMFRREVLDQVLPKLLVKKYAFDLELLVNAHHLKFKIIEAPITLDFQGKFGHINIKVVYKTFMDTLAVFYRLRILKYYDRQDKVGDVTAKNLS